MKDRVKRERMRYSVPLLNHCVSEPMPAADAVFNTFLAALDDYATDKRGDVGSWVRIAAMKAFQTFVIHMSHYSVV